MPSESQRLGSVRLYSKTSDLQLDLSTSIKITPSAEDESDRLERGLTSSILPSSREANKGWVTRGANYRFVLELDLIEQSLQAESDALIKSITARLRGAEV